MLDLQGERFAADLGADNYALPGYLNARRAEYLRSSTPGHNTLSIGDASQPLDADAKVKSKTDSAITIDLSEAYPTAKSVTRTASLDGEVVTITDAIRASRRSTFVWNLHTPATVTKHKGGATLESNGKRVELRVIGPADTVLSAEPDTTRSPQLSVEGITHVRVKVPVDGEAKIKVEFRPAK